MTKKLNTQIHFLINKTDKRKLIKQAKKENISFGAFCRKKLNGDSQLEIIEEKINKLLRAKNE